MRAVLPVVLRVQDFAYELCVGQNGRVWLSAPTARETVLLLQVSYVFLAMTFSKVKAFRGWVSTVSMAKPPQSTEPGDVLFLGV